MRNTMKVAKWEIKRNMKNKSFIIGLFLTPLIFLFFAIVPSLFSDDEYESEAIEVFVKDELGLFDDIQKSVEDNDFINWSFYEIDEEDESNIIEQVEASDYMVYLPLTSDILTNDIIRIYTSEEINEIFMGQIHFIEEPIKQRQIEGIGLTDEEIQAISSEIVFDSGFEDDNDEANITEEDDTVFASDSDPLIRIIPGAFAGIILFSIVISGMMIFQSASQEKKDKIAEIILSSVTPHELMQGKIVGYFVLGIVQVLVWIGFAIPIMIWKFDLPVFDYLFVPELIILLLIAILGYLLFASIFVGLGATIEDVSTSGNFQGMVLMLPFLPFVLIGPLFNDPTGMIAKVGSYIPFTSPAVLIVRLSLLEEWPWMEIVIAITILIISVWLFIKLAGKIFKTGILMYGKNATPKEIWKWLWS